MSGAAGKKPLLSAMMFLQYAVWGIWLPYLSRYLQAPPLLEGGKRVGGGLGFDGGEIGWILGLAGSVGAVASPFLAGQIADRFLNAERYLGLMLIVGGAINFALASAETFPLFLGLSIAYSVAYMPTLALTNSIAFAHLDRPEKEFPPVRVWGSIGWIVASNAFPLLWLQTNLEPTILPPFLTGTEKPDGPGLIADSLRVSGFIAVLYGLFSLLFLPKTPPTRTVEHPLAFARAFALLKHKGFLAVTVAALPIAMIHQVYFIRTAPFLSDVGFADAHIGPVMSIGQLSEIAVLAVLGFFIARLGYRKTLVLGCLAFAARYAIFAVGSSDTRPMIAAAMTLHGLCYGCFFAGAYVYVERVAPKDVRHSAQTVFAIIILGLGPVLAGFYNEWLDSKVSPAESGGATLWATLWWVQAGIAAACAAFVAALFRPGLRDDEPRRAA